VPGSRFRARPERGELRGARRSSAERDHAGEAFERASARKDLLDRAARARVDLRGRALQGREAGRLCTRAAFEHQHLEGVDGDPTAALLVRDRCGQLLERRLGIANRYLQLDDERSTDDMLDSRPTFSDCSTCGAALHRDERSRHVCDDVRQLVLAEVSAFEAELAAWLATAHGRFAPWQALLARRGPPRSSPAGRRTSLSG
jgi:hypothetical protein